MNSTVSTSAWVTSSDMASLRIFFLFALSLPAWGADQEAETSRFLSGVFGQPPAMATLWLTGELRPDVRAILDHDYPAARVRYWHVGRRTVWVLDEIGKEMPITVGIVIGNGTIERMQVLVYRESRGWEVKSPAFTAQYAGARLEGGQKLDRQIDGISGATLSVRALNRLARLALLFDRHITKGDQP